MNPRSSGVDLRRIYDTDPPTAGKRVLVDRLWPRGVSKVSAALDEWLKTVAPSTELRRWYDHDVDRFAEFERRYRAELSTAPASVALEHLVEMAGRRRVSLLTATRDVDHSGAKVLERVVLERVVLERVVPE